MKKHQLISAILLTVCTLLLGLIMINPQTAQAKSYTTPKSVRGTWYSFNMSTYKYNKIHITKHGEYRSGYYYKLRGKTKSEKLGKSKYRQIWTGVNPYDVRTSKGTFLGKKRAVLWVASQGQVTAYFHQHLHLSYQYLF